MAKVKCPLCSERDEKEVMIKSGKRYWHPACLEEHEANKSAEEQRVDRDKNERKQLIAYVCDLYKVDKPSMLVLTQMKRMHEDNGWRYLAIQMTLEYFYEIKNNSTRNSNGIGIVPYVYDEATDYYKKLAAINEQVIGEVKKETIYINAPKRVQRKKRINMEEL